MIDPYWLRVVVVVFNSAVMALAFFADNPHLFVWGHR